MAKDDDTRERRRINLELQSNLDRDSIALYYSDKKFRINYVKALVYKALTHEIWLADHRGRAHTTQRLGRRMGIGKTTAARYIKKLESWQYVWKDGRGRLHINEDVLMQPERVRNVERANGHIEKAHADLRKLDG